MSIDRSKLYDDAADFFRLSGSVVMKLTPESAIQVCREATGRELVVRRIEGGKWHNPSFESRLDCIWDRDSDHTVAIEENNRDAAQFIRSKSEDHGAFIISLA